MIVFGFFILYTSVPELRNTIARMSIEAGFRKMRAFDAFSFVYATMALLMILANSYILYVSLFDAPAPPI